MTSPDAFTASHGTRRRDCVGRNSWRISVRLADRCRSKTVSLPQPPSLMVYSLRPETGAILKLAGSSWWTRLFEENGMLPPGSRHPAQSFPRCHSERSEESRSCSGASFWRLRAGLRPGHFFFCHSCESRNPGSLCSCRGGISCRPKRPPRRSAMRRKAA